MRCAWLAENAGRKKSLTVHHRTTLSGYISTTKACIDNQKKTVYPSYVLTIWWISAR